MNWQVHFNCITIFGNLHKDFSEYYDEFLKIFCLVVFNVNLLLNGDAETSPCAPDKSVVHPTGWPIMDQLHKSTIITLPILILHLQCHDLGKIKISF
jgi:hypothetical protein